MISPTAITDVRREGPGLLAVADTGQFRLTPWAEGIVHVSYTPGAKAPQLPMWGIEPRPAEAPVPELAASEAGWQMHLPGLAVRIAANATLAFANAAGRELTTLKHVRLTPVHIGGEATFHQYAAFAAGKDEGYYGLGQHQRDWMDHAHWDVPLWQDYQAPGGEVIAVPFLVTNNGYGVVWDNVSRSKVWPDSRGMTLWWSEVGEAVSFFLIAGDSADAIYAGYRTLAGATPMPPKSAVGYIQCKQRYASEAELLDVARGYRDRGYPCDLLVVDWFHWKTLGDMDLDERHWPDPAGMNRQLEEMGYDVMISCWPRFEEGSRHYSELDAAGWFMKDAAGQTVNGLPEDPRGALLDTTHPEAAAWFWRTIQDSYGRRGFSSWWVDEDEPDISPHAFYLHAGSGARVHNLYPLTHTRAIYQGHRRDRDDRCLTLSRSAYLGAQKYGTTFWSSDIRPSWDVFRRQIPCGLNFCASGMAWWSSDIGGWHALPQQPAEDDSYKSLLIQTSEARDADAIEDYPELYVRWFQYGAFCPTFRAHGTRPENEVWSYGPAAEAILVKYLRLRYRLMPYIYSLAWRTHCTGAPFMRALFMDFPHDANVRDLKYQYMFGPAFLVAPVFRHGARQWPVYLPAGCDWYDYWTGQKHAGGQTVTVEAPLETLPLFVRAGSIVPHGENVQNTRTEQRDIELFVYGGADAAFDLYRDDGRTYAYENGEYTLTRLAWDDAAGALHVDADPEALFERPQGEYLRVIGQ